MTLSAEPTPGDEVPRADWTEQQEDADPLTDDAEVLPADRLPQTRSVEASEADVLDQATGVRLDDEA